MEENRHAFWEKLAKDVSGNASEEEKNWLRQQPDQELNEVRQQVEKVWAGTALPEGTYAPDVDKGWQRFQLRVQTRTTQPPLPPKRKSNRMWAVAATISLLLVAGAYFIIQSNGPAWTEVRTAANETKTIKLADGSVVALNQNSSFSYPKDFQKENRTVRLKGEAFFEVAKAEGKRFTIFAEGTKTEVIGTSFNLRAYQNHPVKVQVVTGKVAFAKTDEEDAVFLVPGQEGIISKKGVAVAKQPIKTPNFQAWKTKNLVFNNTRLETLILELESYYNVSITIQNNGLRNCRFTTSFKNPELKEVLDILVITGNLTITQNGNQYNISGTGCK